MTAADVDTTITARVTAEQRCARFGTAEAAGIAAWANYTYTDAQSLGFDAPPTPTDYGLAACADDPTPPGYATEQDLDSAIATAPEDDACAIDPTNDTIRVGGAATPAASCAPTGTASNYSHTGVNTITTGGGFSGSRAYISAATTDVPHNNATQAFPAEFAAAWTMLRPAQSCTKWLQIGWMDNSIYPTPGPWVFTDRGDPSYTFTLGHRLNALQTFRLTAGAFYAFRVKQCGTRVCAAIFTNGAWKRMDSTSRFSCIGADGSGTCDSQADYEVFEAKPTQTVQQNPAPGNQAPIKFRAASALQGSGWSLEDPSNPGMTLSASATNPQYLLCIRQQDYNFDTQLGGSC